MRLRYVIPALLLIPLVDALMLVVVADYLGWQATVLLVVLTGLVGMLLVRAEGRHTLRRIQEKAARGEPPADELLDGALLIVAGAFLLTPGVVTDAIGFLLTLPPTRYPIRTVLKRFIVVPKLDEKTGGFVTGGVWTGGFPQGDDGDGTPFGGADGGPFDGDGDDPFGAGDGSGDDEDVYDVGSDSYRVEDE
ncbi:MAG: FxsA family protein [Halolamina sp.]